jgi:outer membrane immunogenic protein
MKMKKQLLASTALALAAAVTSAMAADMALKAPPPAPAPVYSWTGLYVGGNIGYSWGSSDVTYNQLANLGQISFTESRSLDGVIGGPQIGYNWQVNKTWVMGLETDFQWSGEKASSINDPYSIDCEGVACNLSATGTKLPWFGTVRGRVGVLPTPDLWIYGTGGLAYGKVSPGSITNTDSIFSFPPSGNWSLGNSTKIGWTVGGGVEGAVPNTTAWTWKVEYLYIDFGTASGSGLAPCPVDCGMPPGPPYNWSTKITDNILRVGVNYRFH